jgi:hypothetical protein
MGPGAEQLSHRARHVEPPGAKLNPHRKRVITPSGGAEPGVTGCACWIQER